MGTLYFLVGIIMSIGGFIGGIVFGSNTDNFGFCLLEWLSTFIVVIIYFGIGIILSNQETILGKIQYLLDHSDNLSKSRLSDIELKQTNTSNTISSGLNSSADSSQRAPQSAEPAFNEWKCPKCGAINQNYVGTCGCGERKP